MQVDIFLLLFLYLLASMKMADLLKELLYKSDKPVGYFVSYRNKEGHIVNLSNEFGETIEFDEPHNAEYTGETELGKGADFGIVCIPKNVVREKTNG